MNAPVDLDDALAVVGYGSDAVDAALEARLDTALADSGAAALAACLHDLHRAMQAGKPREIRRGTGLIGRLLGRDVVAEAEADGLRQRLGVLLADADRSADHVRTHAVSQQSVHDALAQGIERIEGAIRSARGWLDGDVARAAHPARGALERRLGQLATVQASWQVGMQQLQFLHRQQLELLARYQRIRDVLLPVWRQGALAEAGSTAARQASAATEAQLAIESEVAAMAATLDPSSRTDSGRPA